MGQLVPAPPGTGLRDSPGRARGRRIARLICVADVTLLLYASGPFLAACRRACRQAGLLRADGSGPLAGVPLTHDEITVPLKSRRDAGPAQPGDRAARPGPGDEAGCSRSSAGNGYLMPQPAVQVEVIAMGLAGGGISDVGVQGMPVVGGLRRAV